MLASTVTFDHLVETIDEGRRFRAIATNLDGRNAGRRAACARAAARRVERSPQTAIRDRRDARGCDLQTAR
jgi:hypothetical protein